MLKPITSPKGTPHSNAECRSQPSRDSASRPQARSSAEGRATWKALEARWCIFAHRRSFLGGHSFKVPDSTNKRKYGTISRFDCCFADPRISRNRRPKSQQSQMIRSLLSLTIFMVLGASVIALPGFAPQVQADELAAMAKGDRLETRAVVSNCSTQVWPNFASSCLRHAGSGAKLQEARLVTARR